MASLVLQHGLLETAPIDARALAIARAFNSWWNNCTYLPQLFPQAGGPGYTGPLPHGFNPAAGYTSTSPFANGHLLYWLNQVCECRAYPLTMVRSP